MGVLRVVLIHAAHEGPGFHMSTLILVSEDPAGSLDFPQLCFWLDFLVIGGIELGERGHGSLTSFSLLLPVAFTASSEALEPCCSCIHSFTNSSSHPPAFFMDGCSVSWGGTRVNQTQSLLLGGHQLRCFCPLFLPGL